MSDTITLKISTETAKGDKSKLALSAIITESQLAEIMKLLVRGDIMAAKEPKVGGPSKLI